MEKSEITVQGMKGLMSVEEPRKLYRGADQLPDMHPGTILQNSFQMITRRS